MATDVMAMVKEEELRDTHPVPGTVMPEMEPFMRPVPLSERLLRDSAATKTGRTKGGVELVGGQSPLDSCADILLHCCNCLHTMGTGIAKSIRERLPEAHAVDKQTPYGELAKLGTYSAALVRDVQAGGRELTVVNLYTQFDYGRGGPRRLHYKGASPSFLPFSTRPVCGPHPSSLAYGQRCDWR